MESTDPQFVKWHCVDFFDMSPARRRELVVMVAERWERYQFLCLLYDSTLVGLAYYPNPVITDEHNNLLFQVTLVEYSVFCLMSFVGPAFYGG